MASANTLPIDVAFAQSPPLDLAVTRFASFVTSEALYVNTQELDVLPVDGTQYSTALVERVIKGLEIAEHRSEVALLIARMLQGLLLVYTSKDRPVRRLR